MAWITEFSQEEQHAIHGHGSVGSYIDHRGIVRASLGDHVQSQEDPALAGTVKDWQWINPHSWLQLAVPDGKGGAVAQGFEVGSPNTLFRDGWRSTSFKAGDAIKITYMPRVDGKPGGMLVTAEPAGSAQYLSWLPKGTN